jgi:hypothetical protein
VSQHPSTGDGFGTGRARRPDELRPVDTDRRCRYDLLLGGISVVILVAWLVGQLSGVPRWAAMAAGSVLAAPLVADGLAINPPQ